MKVDLIAEALRECQIQHGRLKDGWRFISGPECEVTHILGVEVVIVPTYAGLTLTEPATYKQARCFEDVVSVAHEEGKNG
jgi:hypothetical protein